MSQPVLLGLLSAAAMIIVGLLSLIGVLWTVTKNFNLGSRTAAVAEETAESTRNAALAKDNQDLRSEISKQWEANQKLRQGSELADTLHKSECEAWAAKEKTLGDKIDALLGQNALLAAKLDQVSAEAGIALRAQERAEGGLQQARRTISHLCPSGVTDRAPSGTAACPDDH